MNRVLGLLILVTTIFSLNNPILHKLYAGGSMGPIGFYIYSIIRILVALALILGHGARVMLPMRLGALAMIVVSVSVPPPFRWLGVAADVVIAGSVYLLMKPADVAKRTAKLSRSRDYQPAQEGTPGLDIACYIMALLMFLSGMAMAGVLALRAGVFGAGDPRVAQLQELLLAQSATPFIVQGVLQFICAFALCFPAARRFVLAAVCVLSLAAAAVSLAGGAPALGGVKLAWGLAAAALFVLASRPTAALKTRLAR